MKALFRVDASAKMGTGHLMRCLALAQALDEAQVEVIFALRASAQIISAQRHDWVGRVVILPAQLGLADEPGWITEYVQQASIELLILDGYQFDADYRLALKQTAALLVTFDDNNDQGPLPCDVVINGATNAAGLGYQHTAPKAVHCLGPEYRVLRREFSQLPLVPLSQRLSLTLVMGGSDPLNITLPLLKALESTGFDDQIRVITGAAYTRQEQLSRFVSRSSLLIQHIHNCLDMASVFSHARLTVSAAGSSQFELAACGSPAILLVVADNQINATLQAVEQGWCEMQDVRKQPDLDFLARGICALWQDENKLQEMRERAYQSGDTQGAERVLEAIRKCYLELG